MNGKVNLLSNFANRPLTIKTFGKDTERTEELSSLPHSTRVVTAICPVTGMKAYYWPSAQAWFYGKPPVGEGE